MLSYEIEQNSNASAGTKMWSFADSMNNRQPKANGQFIELDLVGSQTLAEDEKQEVEDEDLGPEIRSIMINNDKLVALLADSVASFGAETNDEDDDDDDVYDGSVNEGENMGEPLIQMSGRGRKRRRETEENKVDWWLDSNSASPTFSADAAAANDNKQDYEMNLLSELVRRTIEDDNFPLDSEAITSRQLPNTTTTNIVGDHLIYYRNSNKYSSKEYDWKNKINEPFSNRIALNQSSLSFVPSAPKMPTKQRKFPRGRTRNPWPIIGGLPAEVVDQHYGVSSSSSSSSSHNGHSPQLNQNPSQPSQTVDMNYSRLCDDNDDGLPKELFRDCLEMPECQFNGRCFKETTWIAHENSDLARMESRARCRCPIGRGGQLCQKGKL